MSANPTPEPAPAQTQDPLKAAVDLAKRTTKLAQDYKARVDKLAADQAPEADVVRTADALVASGVLDAAHKDAAVKHLGTHKGAVDMVGRLTELTAAAYRQADAGPGSPLPRKQAAAADVPAEPGYDEAAIDEDMRKLAAAAATFPESN